MIKRIDLFMPPNLSQYGVLHHFTTKFHEALLRLGVNSRILEAQYDNPKPFLTELFKDAPDCTLSFNGLLPDQEGRFFCDLIHIPHIAYVVDPPNGYVALAKSPLTAIASVDGKACEFFRGINVQNVFFLPHGVEKNLHTESKDQQRTYDVVLLASCIDYERIRKEWKTKYPGPLGQALEEAADTALANPNITYIEAFAAAVDKYISKKQLDPNKIDLLNLLDELEIYLRGKARVDLIRSIKDVKIDIFGSPSSTMDWKTQLKEQKNVTVHAAVPYDQALEIMQKSKILLNSCAWLKYGVHERVLAGLASGALVFTEDNPYLREQGFSDGTNIAFYRYNELDKVNAAINRYLKNEDLRKKTAAAGRDQVLRHHTWDHRAATLLREIEPFVNSRRQTQPSSA